MIRASGCLAFTIVPMWNSGTQMPYTVFIVTVQFFSVNWGER
jgi:hypothetical protein